MTPNVLLTFRFCRVKTRCQQANSIGRFSKCQQNLVFTLVTTDDFLRRAHKFFKKHPDLCARFAQVTKDLQQDPFAPHLDYHHLQGKLKGMPAVRLTDSYRITLTIVIAEEEIILLDISSHDDLYR